MKLMLLGGKSDSTNAVVNALSSLYPDMTVVIEDDVPFSTFIKRRIKRLGLWTVIGQMAFMFLVPRRLRKKSRERIREIKEQYGMNTDPDYGERVQQFHVSSINDDEVIRLIREE